MSEDQRGVTDDDADGRTADGPGPAAGADADRSVPETEELPAPRPDRSPEAVLRTVLAGLRANDDPFDDAGIVTAFHFSTPAFRSRVGGSLAAYRDHLTDAINRALVGHGATKRGELEVDGEAATEKVVVSDDEGAPKTYSFSLRKVQEGKYEGCWMVDAVEFVYDGESPDHRHMPVVDFDGVEVKCKEGDVLRDVLLRASGVSPYNSAAKYANCNGNAVCGTCAVEVEGDVTEKTSGEKRRLKLPPHRGNDDPNFRLSCQCRVLGDLRVRKHGGTWGQHVQEYTAGTDEDPDADPIRVTDDEYRGDDADGDAPTGDTEEEAELSEAARAMLDEAAERLED